MDYGNIVYILAGITFIGAIAGAAWTYMRAEKADPAIDENTLTAAKRDEPAGQQTS